MCILSRKITTMAYMLDGVCESIWLNNNVTEAINILETYPDVISDYGFKLLCEVIFGAESKKEYEEQRRDSLDQLSGLLTKAFDKTDFYQPTKVPK